MLQVRHQPVLPNLDDLEGSQKACNFNSVPDTGLFARNVHSQILPPTDLGIHTPKAALREPIGHYLVWFRAALPVWAVCA
jgi:hypothetical protein